MEKVQRDQISVEEFVNQQIKKWQKLYYGRRKEEKGQNSRDHTLHGAGQRGL